VFETSLVIMNTCKLLQIIPNIIIIKHEILRVILKTLGFSTNERRL